MPIEAGLLDREITVQRATDSPDPVTGQDVSTWVSDLPIRAQWLPGGTREAWQAQQRLGTTIEGVYEVYDMDPRPTPDTAQILGHDGRMYDVVGVVEIGRNEGLLIAVVARGNQP